jgi:intein/homing endonuclease
MKLSKFIDRSELNFTLPDDFVLSYSTKIPKWGPLGYVTYKRTYARNIDDLNQRYRDLALSAQYFGETEEWWLTVARVVEGVYLIQEWHCKNNDRPWNHEKAVRSAMEMYDLIFSFKFLPPGRGLWMMGTDYVFERGSAALNNPLHEDTKILTKEYGWIAIKNIEGQDVHVLSSRYDYGSHADNVSKDLEYPESSRHACWVPAKISHAEMHPCVEITVETSDGHDYRKIICSNNHRWFRKSRDFFRDKGYTSSTLDLDWSRVSSLELRSGDVLPVLYENSDSQYKTVPVYDVIPLEGLHRVLCAEVPGYEQFVIEGDILSSNCGFSTTQDIYKDFSRPFTWAMDMLMVGVGVGGDTRGSGTFVVQKPKISKKKHIIGDDREGWVAALKRVLDAFAGVGSLPSEWDVSKIRPEGEKIQGFGGTASGPGPLLEMLEWITTILTSRIGQTITTEDIVDIYNLIGRCVVAGNVRRCLAKGTLVLVKDGDSSTFIPIEQVRPGIDQVLTIDGTWVNVLNNFYQGNQLVYMISTKGGLSIKATENHKFPVVGKYATEINDSFLLTTKELNSGLALLEVSEIKNKFVVNKSFINSVEELGIVETYDIEVEHESHLFVANGFLTHNSAEIMFGDPNDEAFSSLKDPSIAGHNLDHHRWASNNSIFAELGMDYSKHGKKTAINGEPGYFWLDNARKYGRMGDAANMIDIDAMGANPCVPDNSVILTNRGPQQVKDLIGQKFVAIVNGQEYPSDDRGFFPTGWKQVYRMKTNRGLELRCTDNHQVLVKKDGQEIMVPVNDLVYGDKVILNNQSLTEPKWLGPGLFDHGWLLGKYVDAGSVVTYNKETAGGVAVTQQLAKINFTGEQLFQMGEVAKSIVHDLGGPEHAHATRKGTHEESKQKFYIRSQKLLDLLSEYGINNDGTLADLSVLKTSSEFHKGFLRGFFDNRGYINTHKDRNYVIQLQHVDLQLLKVIQLMLSHLGIESKIIENVIPEGEHVIVKKNKEVHRIPKARAYHQFEILNSSARKFNKIVGFFNSDKKTKLENAFKESDLRRKSVYSYTGNYYVEFRELIPEGIEEVYDCTIPGLHRFSANGFILSNCNEQTLHPFELCTLVETFPSLHDRYANYARTLKFAYLYAKTVTLLPTHDADTNKVMQKNRRIGLSMTGIVQAMSKHGRHEFLRIWCDSGYKYICNLDAIYSDWLGINDSIKKSSVKPSGSTSLLPGVTAGMHYDESEYYWRVIRFATNSPYVKLLAEHGHRCVDLSPDEPNTTAVYFPVKSEHFERGKVDVSMWEQLELAAQLQYYWADNQVSCLTGDTLIDFNYHQYRLDHLADRFHLLGPGVYDLSTILDDNYRDIYKVRDINGDLQNILTFIVNKPRQALRVILDNDLELVGTYDHKVMIKDFEGNIAWKRFDSLTITDSIQYFPEIGNYELKDWIMVRSVIPAGYQTTYDITVENSHSYVANGFASHNCTVTFNEYEARDIPRALEYYESRLKGVSFLPLSTHGYKHAPYQPITKEEYEEATRRITPVTSFEVSAHEKTERFCSNDSCTV